MSRIVLVALAALLLPGCSAIGHLFGLPPRAIVNGPDEAAWSAHIPWASDAPKVVKTGSGLEYVVLASGPAAGEGATARSSVEIHYAGRLAATGRQFDSSFDRRKTATFPVGGVIPGFSEALKLMRPGDAWLVYIPAALGYGARGAGEDVPPNADLMFEIEMKQIITPPASDAVGWSRYLPWNSAAPAVKKIGGGLEYVVLASGKPDGATPKPGQVVDVYLEGRLSTGGDAVMSTFADGEALQLPVDELTEGFAQTIMLMKPGDRWLVRIPAERSNPGDGEDAIPPGAAIIYEVLLSGVD
jgi:FKBP-type peptidyl-prolyl cis-trans isomerase